MKILLAPDLHCFYDNYGKVLPDGKHSRLADWERTSGYLLQAAVDNEVDIAVFPGDFFKNSRPAPAQVLAVANLLNSFTSYGINVVGCPGNHDLVGIGQPGPCELFEAMVSDECFRFSTVPTVFNINGINIAVLPSVKPATLIDEAADPAQLASIISMKLVEIARGLRAQCEGEKNILIGHWTISGAVASSGQLLYGGTEPVIPLTELQAMEWDAVLFGHIHKTQILCNKPFIGYAGALERVDFGEEDDERGCFIIDMDAGSYQWVELSARKFYTINANIRTADDIQALYNRLIGKYGSEYLLLSDFAGKIVRVKYRVKEDLASMLDHSKMIASLQASVPEYIAGIFPEIETSERSSEASVTEDTSPLDAMAKYLDNKGISGEVKNDLLVKAHRLFLEVMSA